MEALQGATSTNQDSDSVHAPLQALPDQKHSITVSQSPNAKTALASILTSLFLIHFLIFSFLLFILYPIKASCFLPHFVVLLPLRNRDCLLQWSVK